MIVIYGNVPIPIPAGDISNQRQLTVSNWKGKEFSLHPAATRIIYDGS